LSKYRVIVVGAGPAGIFAVKKLNELGINDVVLFEAGKDIKERGKEEVLRGWGGAGAFSDGKLILSPEAGGNLTDYLSHQKIKEMIDEVDRTFVNYGAPLKTYGGNPQKEEWLKKKATMAGMIYVPLVLKHLGTELAREILYKIREDANKWCEFRPNSPVEKIIVENGEARGVVVNGKSVYGKYVIIAPGRVGSEWLMKECSRLGIESVPSPVDIGVRVEVPAVIMEEITNLVYEAKLIYFTPTFNDKVRTFCMNPYGEVVLEKTDGLITVNGHSFKNKKTELTNFALLVSTTFTHPFKDPISYGKYIASLANILGGTVIVQRYGDLLYGRRSTPERIRKNLFQPSLESATPGDLSFVLPYRILHDIKETISAMEGVVPKISSPNTLLYGVEVKFYSNRIKLKSTMETDIKNLYIVGDGAGVSRGLVQSAVSGMIAAEDIGRKEKR